MKLVTQSESAMSTDISNTLEFLMMIFSRNESGIEYHRSICIFCYHHFNSGSIYTVLSTNEEASQASRCHSSGKCPLPPSLFQISIILPTKRKFENEIRNFVFSYQIFLLHVNGAHRTIRILIKRNLRVANGHRI